MWLTVIYKDNEINKWPTRPKSIMVKVHNDITIPITDDNRTFRVSPIFPLNKENTNIPQTDNCKIHFLNYANAYRVLGKIGIKASDQLKDSIYFSIGLNSILIISNDHSIVEEFKKIVTINEHSKEEWTIKNGRIQKIDYNLPPGSNLDTKFELIDYSDLNLIEREQIDEFKIGIKLHMIKMTTHMPEEISKTNKLIKEVNSFIKELLFLTNFRGDKPSSFKAYSLTDLKNKKFNFTLRQQKMDRLIQINNALSKVSTQAFSGAIPILERRSLKRRNSLLGIGGAVQSINHLVSFIESCFSVIHTDQIILEVASKSKPLSGLEQLPVEYNSKGWSNLSIDKLGSNQMNGNGINKLTYFDSRLGFRETEYSISIAEQVITSGADLEWSLITITHEMLHGYVRMIINTLFYGSEDLKEEINWNNYYNNFKNSYNKKNDSLFLIDSIRNILLSYCCLTRDHGSLTLKSSISSAERISVPLKEIPEQKQLWAIFANEQRNISEIIVHILDVHYFYASRVSVYIPLIWCTWVSVPHVSSNYREYILRSLLVIASKTTGNSISRFEVAVERLEEYLTPYKDNKLDYPLIHKIFETLKDKKKLQASYFPAFKASLILVDLTTEVLISTKIRSAIFHDNNITWGKEKTGNEKTIKYNINKGFNDETIKSPVAYLLCKMTDILKGDNAKDDVEYDSIIQFLAINSKN